VVRSLRRREVRRRVSRLCVSGLRGFSGSVFPGSGSFPAPCFRVAGLSRLRDSVSGGPVLPGALADFPAVGFLRTGVRQGFGRGLAAVFFSGLPSPDFPFQSVPLSGLFRPELSRAVGFLRTGVRRGFGQGWLPFFSPGCLVPIFLFSLFRYRACSARACSFALGLHSSG